MPIYVAYDYNGKTLSAVLSARKDLAQAYWHGKDIYPHSTREISDADLKGHPTGVLPIVNMREKRVGGGLDARVVLVEEDK